MSLDFLSAETVAYGPLADAVSAAGATVETRDGWEIAVRFADPEIERLACRERVGWADVSHLRKLEIQGTPAQLQAARPDDGLWLAITSTRALLIDADGPRGGSGARLLDVTSQLGALAIVGPLARELFARFCALDLRLKVAPPGTFHPVSVARTPGYVLCQTPTRYLMLFGAAYGDYIWMVVCDAGTHLGGRPVGVDALIASEGTGHA